MSKVGLILMLCCILLCNGQLNTGSGASPIDSDSNFNCYVGVKISSNFYNQNLQTVQPCNDNLNCVSLTANFEERSLGITVRGEVTNGQCFPSTACSNFSCDPLRQQLAALNPSLSYQIDCTLSCCNTNLCNGPSQSQTPTTDTMSSEVDNVDTSVQQGRTDAENTQVVTGNVSPQSSGNTSYTSTTTTSGSCRSIVNLTAERQQIFSPNYPANYPNRQNCLITLQPSTPQSIVHIRFLVFRTERPFDYVRIFHVVASRSQRLSGSYPNNSLSFNLTGEARVYFYSNRYGNDQGFLADVYETRIFEPTTITSSENACGSTIRVTTQRQLISSPNYPGNYPNRIICNLILQPSTQESVIRIEFLKFDTESGWDYVTFLQNSRPVLRFSGTGTPFNITRTGTVTLRFISDRIRSRKGYLARIYEVPSGSNNGKTSGQVSTTTTTTTATSSAPRSCGAIIKLTAERQQISSPNYPANYPNGQECYILLRPSTPRSIVHVRFLVFRTQRVFDYVQIYNNLISGRQRYSGLYADNSLSFNLTGEVTVRFRSDRSSNSKGFLADVYETKIIEPTTITSSENACGSTIQVTTERQLISSPNYPRNYPNNIFCTLILQPSTQESVIRIDFLWFDTERIWDYIRIVQNSQHKLIYSGSRAPFNITRTGTVTLRFSSNGRRNRAGYLARIYELPAGASETSTNGQTSGIVR